MTIRSWDPCEHPLQRAEDNGSEKWQRLKFWDCWSTTGDPFFSPPATVGMQEGNKLNPFATVITYVVVKWALQVGEREKIFCLTRCPINLWPKRVDGEWVMFIVIICTFYHWQFVDSLIAPRKQSRIPKSIFFFSSTFELFMHNLSQINWSNF